MSKSNWYKESRDEAMKVFTESSSLNGTPKIAVASPIYPTRSETHTYRKNDSEEVPRETVQLFKEKFEPGES